MKAYRLAVWSPLEIGDTVVTGDLHHAASIQLHVIEDIYHIQSMARKTAWCIYRLESGECVSLEQIIWRIDPVTGERVSLKPEKATIEEVEHV